MLTVYMTDIDWFSVDDWDDLFNEPEARLVSNWEGWKERKQVVFEKENGDELSSYAVTLPVSEFEFDMEHEGQRHKYSEELENLLADLKELRDIKNGLYHLTLWDTELDGEMDYVADQFADAYDRAMTRALAMLLAELLALRGE